MDVPGRVVVGKTNAEGQMRLEKSLKIREYIVRANSEVAGLVAGLVVEYTPYAWQYEGIT